MDIDSKSTNDFEDKEEKDLSEFLDDATEKAMDKEDLIVDENQSSSQQTQKTDEQSQSSESGPADAESNFLEDNSTPETEEIEGSETSSANSELALAEQEIEENEEQTQNELAQLAEEEGIQIEKDKTKLEQNAKNQYKESMKEALKRNPDAELIPSIVIDTTDNTASANDIKVSEFLSELDNSDSFLNSDSKPNNSVEEILSKALEDKSPVKHSNSATAQLLEDLESKVTDHDKTAEEKMKGLDAKEEKEIGGIPAKVMTNNKRFHNFENVTIEQEIEGPAKKSVQGDPNQNMSRSDQIQAHGSIVQQQYLHSHTKKLQKLKIRAEDEALKRTQYKIPKGIPDVIFMSDYFNVSGVGEHKPGMAMVAYYGKKSQFHLHFANQAENQISFEDIDTLIGIISDINGIYNGIFKLLPSKKEVEEKSETKIEQLNSALDKAYDILRFYSRLRSFVNTVVYQRHLIVADMQKLRRKVNYLQTDEDDMLRFYALQDQYLKVKTRGLKYDYDPKIKLFLKKVDQISVPFGADVKTILRSVFKLEKAIVFFDSDIRSLAMGVNTENPIEVLKTIDNVMMLLIRIMEAKDDILKTAKETKAALKGIVVHRGNIVENLSGAEQLIHYYRLQAKGVWIWSGIQARLILGLTLIFGVIGKF